MKKILSIALVVASLFSASAWAEMVNINKASAAAIQENLKGVGEKKAEAIVAWRTEHGEFKTLEDIKQVKGIGDGIFEKIKADISLDEGVTDLVAKTTEGKKPGVVTKTAEEKMPELDTVQPTGKLDKKAEKKTADKPAKGAAADKQDDKKVAAETGAAGKS